MLRNILGKFILAALCLCSLTFVGGVAADPIFHDTNGKAIQLHQLRGKWVVVNYWAGWCGGCIMEIPELNHFYKTHQDGNVVFFGVNYDQLPPDRLKDTMARTAISFPVLLDDPNQEWGLGDIEILPTTFIINPKGRVVKKIVGPSTEENLMAELHAVGA